MQVEWVFLVAVFELNEKAVSMTVSITVFFIVVVQQADNGSQRSGNPSQFLAG